jgi:predicted MFS family arabinose efflux permease
MQHRAVFLGYAGIIVFLVAFPFVPYIAQLVFAFFIAAFLEILVLALATIVTHRVKPERYGRVESVMQVSSNIGIILGGILLGSFTQWFGNDKVFLFLALIAIVSLAGMYFRRRYLLPQVIPKKH